MLRGTNNLRGMFVLLHSYQWYAKIFDLLAYLCRIEFPCPCKRFPSVCLFEFVIEYSIFNIVKMQFNELFSSNALHFTLQFKQKPFH